MQNTHTHTHTHAHTYIHTHTHTHTHRPIDYLSKQMSFRANVNEGADSEFHTALKGRRAESARRFIVF